MSFVDRFVDLFETGPGAKLPVLRHSGSHDDTRKFDRERTIVSQVFSAWSAAMLFQGFTSVLAFLALNVGARFPDAIMDAGGPLSAGLPQSTPDIFEGLVFFGFLIRFLTHSDGLRVIRRFFLLHGAILALRSVTILLTPYPNIMPGCADASPLSLASPGNLLHLFLLFPGHTCGDYVFSGHTVLFVLCAIFWRHEIGGEATSSRLLTVTSALGIVSLPLFRYHYSIDCVVAIGITVLTAGIFLHTLNPNDILFDFPSFVYDIDDETDDAVVLAGSEYSATSGFLSFA